MTKRTTILALACVAAFGATALAAPKTGAPIPDDAVPAIVDYLTAQYGKP